MGDEGDIHRSVLTKKESNSIQGDPRIIADIAEIQSDAETIAKNAALYEVANFEKRAEAIDFLEFHIIDRIESLCYKPAELTELKDRAGKIKLELEEIDNKLFRELRAGIRAKRHTPNEFKDLINNYCDLTRKEYPAGPGYDNLDVFINRLCSDQQIPDQTKALEPEMVFYQKTPARIVFELAEKISFREQDVFYDLGSGLGQVAILINLLTGVKAVGIEFEPAFCDYASNCAEALNLTDVTFINTDARQADYTKGTVFFMYTPFGGEILRKVLELLHKACLLKKITVVTYGPCTSQVNREAWLNSAGQETDHIYKLCVFTSITL